MLFEHGFNFALNVSDITRENIAARTDHCVYDFVRENIEALCRCGDDMLFESLMLTPLCLRKSL